MAEQVVDDGEKKHARVEPEGAAPDLSPREPGEHREDERELSSDPEKQYDLGAARTVTQTTTASAFPLESQPDKSAGRKPWYKNLNPLKRGKAIPVPAERTVSKEYGANFLSVLTFQWMAPLMKVQPTMVLRVVRRGILGELTGKLGRLPTTFGTQ